MRARRRAHHRRRAATLSDRVKLLLLDGNSLTYRAFFALPTDMATASGQVTNAVFGFTSMLINLLKDHKPDGIMVAFDRPEPTFRHEMNVEYKAQREAAPDILRQQMGLVRQVLEALRITIIELAGWEADDIIATISRERQERRPRHHHRHRRPRHVPARVRPARQGALQPPRRQRLRVLRRGRHLRAHRRHAGAVRRLRGACAATPATTCPACRVSARRPRPS